MANSDKAVRSEAEIFCQCGHTMEVHSDGNTHECLDLIDEDVFCPCQNFTFASLKAEP